MPWFPTVVLSILGLLWGWVLIRPAIQNMLNGAHRDPVGHFNRHLSVLGQTPARSRAMASGGSWQAQPARKRRLQLFMALLISSVVSLLLAVILGGIFWWQHLLLDVILVGFLVVAARAGAHEHMRGQNVTFLDNSHPLPVPNYARAVGDRS